MDVGYVDGIRWDSIDSCSVSLIFLIIYVTTVNSKSKKQVASYLFLLINV